jgi:TRAP-type C4-dicarboxylate transport system substrate-binding protein
MPVGREGSLRLLHMLAGALLLLHQPTTASAQTVWNMTTEYPQGAVSGLGVTTFAQHVARLGAGKLVIQPSFDAAKGVRSADMLTALAEGRVEAGDAFAGSLEAEDAIFALPSLPFLVTSIADARRLAELARPYLSAALQKRGARLLYLTLWPPSGIWSKAPVKTSSDLSGLSIRTYDRISREVFATAGARATFISFAETVPRLVDGSINAVLSSGDGDAGRKLWQFLPYFTDITYSLPLSVASVNQAAYDALAPELRDAVDSAGRQTETEIWLALSSRLQQNHQRMREAGVMIDANPSPALVAALRSGAEAAQQDWCARSGPACQQVLGVFKSGKP